MLKITLNHACTDTALATLQRDQLLFGANNGVLELFDIANSYCYDQTTAIATGNAVNNINESGNNGSVIIASGQALSLSGNGVVYDALTASGSYINGNAAGPSNIWNGGAGDQYFMFCMYCKLPTAANWNTGSAVAMMQFAANTGNYQNTPDLLLISQDATSNRLSFRRQKAASTIDSLYVIPTVSDYGSFVQLAFWRNASGQFARLKSANGTVISSSAVSTNNTQDFSATTQKVGYSGTLVGSKIR